MLQINHLTKHYPGSSKGVTDLSLHVAPGDLYAFIGHNGAGKTTTLKAICGIHGFDRGEIFVDGISVAERPLEAKARLAYIPDNPDLFDDLTGIQYLNFVADVFGLTAGVRQERIAAYAAAFEITASLGDPDPGCLLPDEAELTPELLAVLGVSNCFHSISRSLGNVPGKHDYQIGDMAHRSMTKALYLREVKRYASSSIYVTNTIIGPIMAVILSVGLCVSGLDAFPMDLRPMLPFVLGGVFCMMTTTAVSISMEGRQLWVIQSLPIPAKAWLDSKILLNLTRIAPCCLVSLGALTIALRPGLLEFLWLALIPAAIILFSLVFGITVNLRFHSIDWEREETVVKQSLSAMAGGFAGPLLSAALAAAVWLTPAPFADAARAVAVCAVLILTAVLYQKNNRSQLWAL